MDCKIDYRQEGYQQGYRDGKSTCGKISKKYTDALFESKTDNLSPVEFCEFITGWQNGFAVGVTDILGNLLQKEGSVIHHIA
jgi:hypothetical protein